MPVRERSGQGLGPPKKIKKDNKKNILACSVSSSHQRKKRKEKPPEGTGHGAGRHVTRPPGIVSTFPPPVSPRETTRFPFLFFFFELPVLFQLKALRS